VAAPPPPPPPPAIEEPPAAEPVFEAPPERPSRGRGRSGGEGRRRPRSIEEELAADLEAAEIGEPPHEGIDDELVVSEESEAGEEDYEDEDLPPRFRERRPGGEREDRRGRGRERGRGGPRRMGGGGRPGAGRPKPLIQDIFRRGQEVIVQVIKEGIGTKGPTLSTYISIAGRYLVLMPGLNRVGVSRKINDEEQRRRLRDIFNELKPPRGLGFIIRTAGVDRNKKELHRDLAYLSRLWQVVVRRIRKTKTPAVIYEESDMITRTIRDTFTGDIDTVYVDETRAFEDAQEFMQVVMPRYADRLKLYDGTEPLFHKYGIEAEIARIHQRKVPLPNGGSIVIDQTEALVAIDVNSGNFRADNNAEETAYQMNLLAAREIARQLRLRNLGGVVVNDFIDMREERHRRGVEKALRDAMKRDRSRTKILRMSQFGLIEMTRQRVNTSLKRSVYEDCPYCHGHAQVKTVESMSIEVMRLLQLAAHRDYISRVEVRVAQDVANYLLNRKRREIARLEESGNLAVSVEALPGVSAETLELVCLDNNGNEVKLMPVAPVPPSRPRR
jgi:ribonuclease E